MHPYPPRKRPQPSESPTYLHTRAPRRRAERRGMPCGHPPRVCRAVAPGRGPSYRGRMTRLESASPVLCTRDLPAALERYARLGFTVWAYEDGEDYGYARRDGVWLHLTRVADLDPATTLVSA